MKHRFFIFFFSMTVLALGLSACNDDESALEPGMLGSSENEIIVSAAAGTYEMEVYTNIAYHVSLIDTADWLTISAGQAVSNLAVVEIKYDANEGFNRKARFALISDVDDEPLRDTVTFMQRAGKDPVLRLADASQVTLSGDGGEAEVAIVTNIPFEDMSVTVDYTESDGVEWVSNIGIVAEGESEERTLTFTYDENPEETPRSAKIILSFVDSWGSNSVYVEVALLQESQDSGLYKVISFEDLRNTYATGETITDYVAVKGVVVSNKELGNAGCPVHTGPIAIDYTPTTKTIYFESEDAKYGIAIYADSNEDNIFDQFDRMTLLLTGAKLTKTGDGTNCPVRYELTDFDPTLMVFDQTSGDSAPVKKLTMEELTDDDLYTYVDLYDVELPIRKGSLMPVEGGYASEANGQRITKYPVLVRSKGGDDMYMYTNDRCLYRRDGTRLPYGSGTLHGVIVHEHFSRYEWASGHMTVYSDVEAEKTDATLGNIGKYQIRHQTKNDIWDDMNDDFEDGFSALLCEYRYRVLKYIGNDDSLKAMGDSLDVPSYGTNGWFTHTKQPKYSGDDNQNSYYGENCTHLHYNGQTGYDYLGPCGDNSNTFGTNYGNRNGLGIVIDTDHENKDYWPGRFAMNDDGKWELACQYAKNIYAGYGPTGWVDPGTSNIYAPNYNGSNPGKGRNDGALGVAYTQSNWWNSSTDKPFGYLINVSTQGISSSEVSMQICMRSGVGNGQSPRHWIAEWTDTDPAYGVDVTWNTIGEFTVPDTPNWDNENMYIWLLPGNKQINLKVSTEILGKDNVYIQIRPSNKMCWGGNGTDYDTTTLMAVGWTDHAPLSYFAIRYNK